MVPVVTFTRSFVALHGLPRCTVTLDYRFVWFDYVYRLVVTLRVVAFTFTLITPHVRCYVGYICGCWLLLFTFSRLRYAFTVTFGYVLPICLYVYVLICVTRVTFWIAPTFCYFHAFYVYVTTFAFGSTIPFVCYVVALRWCRLICC